MLKVQHLEKDITLENTHALNQNISNSREKMVIDNNANINNNTNNNINTTSNNNNANNSNNTQPPLESLENLQDTQASNDTPKPNCLALTVRKDYNLTIFKNIFTTGKRISLKIAISTLVLNFLRMFF